MGFTTDILSLYHTFSKTPVDSNTGSAAAQLGNAINKSGHTVQSSEVWSDEIPFFGAAGTTTAAHSKFSATARTNDLVMVSGVIYQRNATAYTSGATFATLWSAKTTSITSTTKNPDGTYPTEQGALTNGSYLLNAAGKPVIKYHLKQRLTILTADNNANTDSNKKASRLQIDGKWIEQFVGPTDNYLNGNAAVSYAPAIFSSASSTTPYKAGAGNNYMDYCATGTILWESNTGATGNEVITCFEYIGSKLSTSIEDIKTDVENIIGTTMQGVVAEVKVASTASTVGIGVNSTNKTKPEITFSAGTVGGDYDARLVTGTIVKSYVDGQISTVNAEVAKKADKTTVEGIDTRVTTIEGQVATLQSGKLTYKVVHSVAGNGTGTSTDAPTFKETSDGSPQNCVEYTIYLVPETTATATAGEYVEWLCCKKGNTLTLEQIGTTAADLSGYATTGALEALDTRVETAEGKITTLEGVVGDATKGLVKDVVTAQTTANQGVTDAAAAQSTANTAVTDAAAAQTTANEAKAAAATNTTAIAALQNKVGNSSVADQITAATGKTISNSDESDDKHVKVTLGGTVGAPTVTVTTSGIASANYVGTIPSGSTATSVVDYAEEVAAAATLTAGSGISISNKTISVSPTHTYSANGSTPVSGQAIAAAIDTLDSGNTSNGVTYSQTNGKGSVTVSTATTGQYGTTQLLTSITSESETLAATPKAVKLAIADAATTAQSKANTALADAKTYTNEQIKTVTDNATALTTRVTNAESAITKLNGEESVTGSVKATAKSYADAAQAAAEATAAADATSKANQALADAKTYADQAKADAIASAATDATTKANAAQAAAKTYTDGQIDAVRDDLEELSGGAITKIVGDTSSELVKVAAAKPEGDSTTVNLTVTVNNVAKASDLTALTGRVTTAEDHITTLTGSGEGSVAKAAADALASAKAHTNTEIGKIDTAYKAADADLSGRIADNEDKLVGITTVTSAIATAKTEAIADAKTYTDGQISTLSSAAVKSIAGDESDTFVKITASAKDTDGKVTLSVDTSDIASAAALSALDTKVTNHISDAAKLGIVVAEATGEDNHPNVTSPSTNKIYLVAAGSPESGTYVEWIYVEKSDKTKVWEKIGTTATDLTEYAKAATVESDIATAKSEAIAAAATDAKSKADAAQAAAETTAANALSAAKTDLEGKIATAKTGAETTAKNYTDNQIAALSTGTGAIAGLTTRVTTLEGKVDVDKVSEAIATAKTAAINAAATDATNKADAAEAAAISAAATDATTKADAAQAAAISAAATDATTKASTAKSEAIAAAATDATTKANTAESNAKSYTDTEIGKLDVTESTTNGIKWSQTNGKVSISVSAETEVTDGSDKFVTSDGVHAAIATAQAAATTKVQKAATTVTADVTSTTATDKSTTYTIDTLSDVTITAEDVAGATSVEGNKITFADGSVKYVDWSRVTVAEGAFQGNKTLTKFHADLDRLTNGNEMFSSCSALTSFCGNLGSLTDGTGMFSGCKLDLDSVIYIIDSLPVYAPNSGHTITIGTTASIGDLKTEAAAKGWTVI